MTDTLILPILKNIQEQVQSVKAEQIRLRTDINMQFSALNEKLNGHLISELELRNEFNNLVARVQLIEKRLEPGSET